MPGCPPRFPAPIDHLVKPPQPQLIPWFEDQGYVGPNPGFLSANSEYYSVKLQIDHSLASVALIEQWFEQRFGWQ